MGLKRSGGIVVVGLFVVAASQGGCGLLFFTPGYDPGVSGTLEFRDIETDEVIEGDVLMVEYRSRSDWTSSRSNPDLTPVSADVSRVRTGTYLWRWGRFSPSSPDGPMGLLGLGYIRPWKKWSAYFWKDGYLPAFYETPLQMQHDGGDHGGPLVFHLRLDSDRGAVSSLTSDADRILTELVPLIPGSNPQRRELLLLLER